MGAFWLGQRVTRYDADTQPANTQNPDTIRYEFLFPVSALSMLGIAAPTIRDMLFPESQDKDLKETIDQIHDESEEREKMRSKKPQK